VSWFTFKDLFWRCHLRQICAPTLSVAGFAIDPLSYATTAARPSALDDFSSSRPLEKSVCARRQSG
jgi:hypothetical protein